MYLTESERKRIKGLYEASTASGAGSYETPMGFKAERPEMVGELPDEMDMGISDDEGIGIDVDELMGMLGMSEDDDKERMRQLHKDNSVVVEQAVPEISKVCLDCVEEALTDRYKDKANRVASKIMEVTADGEITATEFTSAMGTILREVLTIGVLDIIPIGTALYGCVEKCKSLVDPDISMEI